MNRISNFIIKHYKLILVISVLLLGLSVYFAGGLKTQTRMEDMLPETSETVLAQDEFNQYFDSEESVLVVARGEAAKCREYLDTLGAEIAGREIASGVLYKVETDEIEEWLPLYGDTALYRRLENGEITPQEFFGELTSQGQADTEYLVSSDGGAYMMVVKPDLSGKDYVGARDRFFTGLTDAMDRSAVEGVEAGYTGGTFVQDYQADSVMFESLSLTTLIALVLIILLIIGSFGRVLLPLLSGLPLILGVTMAAAFAALAYGSINVFTVSFAALLLGLGIDFAVHILNRYFEEREKGADLRDAIGTTLRQTGGSIIIGAATTAFAFLAFLFAEFKAFVQMGVVSGIGIVLLCLVMMAIVPALIMLTDSRGKRQRDAFGARYGFLDTLGRFSVRRAVPILVAAVLLTGALVFPILKTTISTDIGDIYPEDLPANEWLRVVEDAFDYNPNTLSVMVDDARALREAGDDLRGADGVRDVASALDYLPGDQDYKLGILHRLGLSDIRAMTVKDLPQAVRDNYVGRDGRLLLEIVPEGDVGDADTYSALAERVRDATGRTPVGMPAVMNAVVEYVRSDVLLISLLCMGVILVFLLIAYRSVKTAVITMVPVALSVFATMGVMELLGFTTTIFSIVGLPLIIGIGIDSGVHMMHRLLREDDPAAAVSSTGKAVIMTTLTTLIGFGSIAFSSHKGLAGLGMTVVIGMAFCMAITLILLPALKAAFIKGRTEPAEGDGPRARAVD